LFEGLIVFLVLSEAFEKVGHDCDCKLIIPAALPMGKRISQHETRRVKKYTSITKVQHWLSRLSGACKSTVVIYSPMANDH
jgi:hypothetical protein